jgi:hypothetical protein
MLSLIDDRSGTTAHPAFWAPFVVVREGAAPKVRPIPAIVRQNRKDQLNHISFRFGRQF